jgi:hypothetical protein
MKRKEYILLCLIPVLATGFSLLNHNNENNDLPSDKHATKETINLYHNLKRVLDKGVMVGHQDDWLMDLDGNMSQAEVT